MSHRMLFTVILLGCTSTVASAHTHRRATPVMQNRLSDVPNDAAAANAALITPPPARLVTAPTFVELHSARVENDLMLFSPAHVATMPVHTRDAELFAKPPEKKPPMRLFTPLAVVDPLEVRRDRDKMLLFRGAQPSQGGAVGLGAAMFGATTILSAHAPRPVRVVFDGPVHLGPAIFDGGGMGAGIAGRL
jgi:hypothetical protein